MKYFALIKLVLVICFSAVLTYGQQIDSIPTGTITGTITDSVYNHVMKSATVAVYSNDKNVLLNYTLTDNFGHFRLLKLPLDIELKIVISSDGYQSTQRSAHLSRASPIYNFQKINVSRNNPDSAVQLNEVEIKQVAPVRLRGDTLEFNADAFHLDPNAVVDDLMRRLPGITVWSDGLITVNGRKVNQLLVEGKPFFGGTSKVALQNLPVNSVDKIQIYKSQNETASDSLVNMNIKLKSDKQIGAFGKLGGGLGTRTRYANDLMMNFFNKTMQIAVVGAYNNINNFPTNIDLLIQSNSFKGGTDIDYQPNFSLDGTNKTFTKGALFQYDFEKNSTSEVNNRLNIKYFSSNANRNTIKDVINVTSIDGSSNIAQNSLENNRLDEISHDLTAHYNNKKENFEYSITPTMHLTSGKAENEFQSTTTTNREVLASSNNTLEDRSFSDKKLNISTNFKLRRSKRSWLNNSELSYNINHEVKEADQKIDSRYIFYNDNDQSDHFSRNYVTNGRKQDHEFNLKFGRFSDLFRSSASKGIVLGLNNALLLSYDKKFQKVFDLNATGESFQNDNLSNKLSTQVLQYFPGLTMLKEDGRYLEDRYQKLWRIQTNIRGQFVSQSNRSDKAFQNFNRNYKDIVLDAIISYNDHLFGKSQKEYKLTYKSKFNIPEVEQLAPIVDRISLYYLRLGNPNLKKEYAHYLTAAYESSTEKAINNRIFSVSLEGLAIADKISDSIIYDDSGRRNVYSVNAAGYLSFTANVLFQQAMKLSKHDQLQMTISSKVNSSRMPNYIDGQKNESQIFTLFGAATLHYENYEKLAVNLQQEYSGYHSKQDNSILTYNMSYARTMLSSTYAITKKLSIGSNLSYVKNLSDISTKTDFVIWNVNLVKRALANNGLEIKLSALDLLRQNSNVVNYAFNNTVTTGYVNVLQNYFMITVSYFPRFFGKKKLSQDINAN